MNRLKANLKILATLDRIVSDFPQLRFQQILYIYNIVEDGEDKFYEESEETLKKLRNEIVKRILISIEND